MKVKNKNYCGTIVKINTLVPIENNEHNCCMCNNTGFPLFILNLALPLLI